MTLAHFEDTYGKLCRRHKRPRLCLEEQQVLTFFFASFFLPPSFCEVVTRLRVPLATCCGPGDVEVFASRAPEVWRCAAGVLSLCLKSSGALEACCGAGDVDA